MKKCKLVNGYGIYNELDPRRNRHYNVYECGAHYEYDMHSEDVIEDIEEKHLEDHKFRGEDIK